MNMQFIISALVHGVVFALFMLVGNWIWHWGRAGRLSSSRACYTGW